MQERLLVLLALTLAPCLAAAQPTLATNTARVLVPSSTNTCWWAGIIDHGYQMPLADGYEADLWGDTYGNQGQPLLLSSGGDVLWSEDPFAFQGRKSS